MVERARKITAQDIMSDVVVTVSQDIFVKDAAHLMMRDRIHGVPVINTAKEIVGILTLTDLFKVVDKAFRKQDREAYNQLLQGTEFTVREIMTTSVVSVAPQATLEEIISLSLDMHIHLFPVMDGKKLVGIVGSHDILNAIFNFF